MFDKGTSSHLVNSRNSLDSPMRDSPRRQSLNGIRRQSSSTSAALSGAIDSASPKLELLSTKFRDICIWAHSLWITWVSDELSAIPSKEIHNNDALSLTSSSRSWEETVIKQENSSDGPVEMKIELPSMPSLYLTSFLYQASEEVPSIYGSLLSTLDDLSPKVTERGVLQILLDLRFVFDVLSGGDFNMNDELSKTPKSKLSMKSQVQKQDSSISRKRVLELTSSLSQRLNPIDWQTYESCLWENEKQAYIRICPAFVGTRFGETTLKLGSMLTDWQVGRLKEKSAAAMSGFGDMLPVQAAGLLNRSFYIQPLNSSYTLF
ncbi:hypothetical protein MKX01_014383 [Papaver californicum]|nr:hypothetical protein MKX01_014383 [Papaver californicum]